MKALSIIFVAALSMGIFPFVAGASLKVATYNLGLAHGYVPLAQERMAPLGLALASSDADILCLQEVWSREDRRQISDLLVDTFDYHYGNPVEEVRSENGPPTCCPWDLFGEGKFVSCMSGQCGDLEGRPFNDCVLNRCQSALQKLKQKDRGCATALMAQVGKDPVAVLLTLFNPLWKAGIFAYEGSDGLMLLSKYPLKEKPALDWSSISTLNKRAAIVADANIEGKPLRIICTHLTSNFDGKVPYTGVFDSWAEENLAQMTDLLTEASRSPHPTLMLGDFNCGLKSEIGGLDADLEDSCRLVPTAGFVDVLMEMGPECTFCADGHSNTLLAEGGNYLIDHVYSKGINPLSARVVFKEKVQVKTEADGRMVTTNLSDHFGVLVEFDY